MFSANLREGSRYAEYIKTEMTLLTLGPATHAFGLSVRSWDIVAVGFDGPVLTEALDVLEPVWSVLFQLELLEAVLNGGGVLKAVKELPGRSNIKVVESDLISAPEPLITRFSAHLLKLGKELVQEDANLLIVLEASDVHLEHRLHHLVVIVHRDLHISTLPGVRRP